MALSRLPTSACSPRRLAPGGFTFIELIVVMGILAMLMGLTVGYIRSAGRVNALGMARTQLLDAAYRAQGMSAGERIAMLTFRAGVDDNGRDTLEVITSVAETMVTHAFETLDGASGNLPNKVAGAVKLLPFEGQPGSCALFGRGGAIEFDPQARFAATDGLDVELWVMPEAGPTVMTLVEGLGAYELALFRGAATGDYDLRLKLFLRPEDEAGEPSWVSYESVGQPVKVNGRWTHLHASFDGVQASFRVDGLEHAKRPEGRGPEAQRAVKPRRIAVPQNGAVALLLGSSSQPYVGRMDTVVVRGVFRLADERTKLPEGIVLEVVRPPKQSLPFRVTYRNGRLEPDRHAEDVLVRLGDSVRTQDPPLELRLSRHGVISADLSATALPPVEGPAGAPSTTPGGGPR